MCVCVCAPDDEWDTNECVAALQRERTWTFRELETIGRERH